VPFPQHVGPGGQPENEIAECDHEGRNRIPAIAAHGTSRESGGGNGWRHQPGCSPPGCVAHPRPGRPARPRRYGQSGGEAGGEASDSCAQVRVRTRDECLADPQVEVALGQRALRERGLELVDHLLALGVRHPQVTAARRGCRIPVYRPCHLVPPRAEDRTTA
jgi:hypothetical protein